MSELVALRDDHLEAVLVFELENRAYFARSISDRGDAFFAEFPQRFADGLAAQASGECGFYVLEAEDGTVVGRFNLYDIDAGSARVGYRVAERVAGAGVATGALRALCQRAADDHAVIRLEAETSEANIASQRVLAHVGFRPVGAVTVAGQSGVRFEMQLVPEVPRGCADSAWASAADGSPISAATVPETLRDWYIAATLARWRIGRPTVSDEVHEPGLAGLLASAEHPGVSLMVSDDQCLDTLAAILAAASSGFIQIFAGAPRCTELLKAAPAWSSSAQTAMGLRQLSVIPPVELPEAVSLRAVRRLPDDPADGVPLAEVVAAVIHASPGDDGEGLESSLRSMPGAVLFAALGPTGTVCATSGFQLVGDHARIILVDTDPAWRRRGLGRGMTAHALTVARSRGATAASLDASALGRRVYEQLGFESAGETTRFIARTSPG